jgi:hypothetical protein
MGIKVFKDKFKQALGSSSGESVELLNSYDHNFMHNQLAEI